MPPGEVPGARRRVDQLRRHQPRGRVSVDLVGLEEIEPAGDQEGREVLERGRAGRGVGLAVAVDRVDDDARPLNDRQTEIDLELVALAGLC